MTTPWERQPDEPINHYRYFEMYRGMGISRSLESLAKLTQSDTSPLPPKIKGTLKNYSAKYKWQERIQAWEDWQSELRLERELEELGQRHTAEMRAYQQSISMLSKKQLALANQMLTASEQSLKKDPGEACGLAKTANTLIGLSGSDGWGKSLAVDTLLKQNEIL